MFGNSLKYFRLFFTITSKTLVPLTKKIGFVLLNHFVILFLFLVLLLYYITSKLKQKNKNKIL
jgi:hypothetical protein